jgi:hypothetical protein
VDMHVIDFLRKFRENSLLANVNLELGINEEHHRQILPVLNKILPLIISIDSIDFCALNVFDWFYEDDEESKLLLKTMVAQTRILSIKWLVLCSRNFLNLHSGKTTGTALTAHGRTKSIGAVLGFTPQETMICREHWFQTILLT